MGEMRTASSIFVGEPEGKRIPGRPRRKKKIILKCILKKQ
jgi:hypothetical protein